MDRSETWKTLLCFGLFGGVVLGLFARLLYLQGTRADANLQTVRKHRDLVDPLPQARGEILDRHGARLAYDRPALEVRADFEARVDKGTRRIPDDLVELLAHRLASHLAVDAEHPDIRRKLARTLVDRIAAPRPRPTATRSQIYDYLKVNFLVSAAVDSYEAVARLQQEVDVWRSRKMRGRLHLYFVKTYRRTYPGREATRGVVGTHYVAERQMAGSGGGKQRVRQSVGTGLEACSGLWSEPAPLRATAGPHQVSFKDAARRRFWTPFGSDPQQPVRLHATLDLELQQLAHQELRAAAAAVAAKYSSGSFDWGAMVLCEVATGDILALASHYPGADGPRPFAPIENAFEPGSVVKPLVVAFALERGLIRWDEEFDCTPTMRDHGRPVAGHPRRIIRDDHACGVLTPQGIIVNSSNIGAVQVGVRLRQEGMQAYFRAYGLCRKTGLPLPGESEGLGPNGGRRAAQGGIDNLTGISDRKFGRFTGPSVSFGYEHNVTAVQLARAYLRLLTGERRELRLVSAVDTARGRLAPGAEDYSQTRFLSKDTVEKVRAAMAAVVSGDEHATGRGLHQMLVERGITDPLIGGKTGTSDSGIRGLRAKTAAFVGFAPVHAPRYLVVCVLRKDRAARFYGGSYAAPAAGRLLLGALARKPSAGTPARQVSAWFGVRGHSSSKK